MIKKLVFGIALIVATSCGTSRPVIAYTKSKKTPTKAVVKPTQPVAVTKTQSVNTAEPTPANTNSTSNSTEVLAATTRVKVTTAMVLEYIEKYKEIVQNDVNKYIESS